MTFEQLPGQFGQTFGPSDWITIDQGRIDRFAEATLDPQWIHTDPERAAAGPFGTTVAHGYLTLSLLVTMVQQLGILPESAQLVVNYGLDKVRYPAPVPSGSRVRCSVELKACDPKGEGRLLLTLACTVEIEGSTTPALVAQVLYLVIA
ncbi:MAG: MaoC family dehydratase [Trueperaceae bacterium]